MTEASVPLESILSCFEGVIPSPIATCSSEGMPNITYLSIVQYIDSDRVALSRQFFNKTRANLDANPQAQVWVVDPETFQQYVLDLEYLHTESEGPIFDALKANLDAVASQQGMGDVFRLRGADIHRVCRCAPVGDLVDADVAQAPRHDTLVQLDEFVRRIAACLDYESATRAALQALDDVFGFSQSILLAADENAGRLFAIADNGYPNPSAGAEVGIGVGVIGVAAERRRVVCVANLARSRAMRTAVQESVEQRGAELPGRDIPLPGLEQAQSAAAVPLIAHGGLLGVLYLESERAGHFGAHNERILRILAGHLATALAMLEGDRHEVAETGPGPAVTTPPGDTAAVTHYLADDSVFVEDEYVIKGVPGRILCKLLNEHLRDGRTVFTNRELRLDERLGLPSGNDNLEARLLVLRKRLAARECGIGLERVGRGRLSLSLARPVELCDVPTAGPFRTPGTPASAG